MFDVTKPMKGYAMTKLKIAPCGAELKALLLSDEDGFRSVLQAVIQEALEAEMTEALQAHKSERTGARLAYRSGYYERQLVTRVGVLELRVPQDRAGRFSTELFERYQRSEKALVAALAQMYVQGVSTRKVKAITEELCGHSFGTRRVKMLISELKEWHWAITWDNPQPADSSALLSTLGSLGRMTSVQTKATVLLAPKATVKPQDKSEQQGR
jgi:hypothetical protein